MKKVCVITCYAQPDYIRARTIRAGLGLLPDVEVVVVKNTHTGFLRYGEVVLKLIKTRLTDNPDMYILTFRGYEMLPIVRIITLGRKLVFDEFVNLIEHTVYEHHRLKAGALPAKILQAGYRFWLKSADIVLTDTPSHADYSSELMKLPRDKYVPLIVSTDEETFDVSMKERVQGNELNVFFYGLYMLPLHGLDVMLDAMKFLKSENITLHIIGGKEQTADIVRSAQDEGAKVTYEQHVHYEDLVGYIHDADIVLGGPFGNTVQSQFVIGGKVFQFLRSGKPTVIGQNKESGLFTDKKDALVIPEGDAQALADVLKWAKLHPKELWSIGEAGRKLYEAKLSNKVLASELRGLLARKELS
jgi:glycosyltransferase involved in cell wall biosynthesis